MGSKHWTDEEDNYLLSNYGEHPVTFLSKVLERSESAIRNRYAKLKEQEVPKEQEYFLSRANRYTPRKLKKYRSVTESKASKPTWSGRGNPYAHTKTGYRNDLDIVLRSGWEANILRVLKSFGIKYDYEPQTFAFPVKKGNKSYTPDIWLPNTSEWIEVKGYLDKNSAVKIKRFKTHYPEEFENLTMIIGASNKTREFCRKIGVPTVLEYPQVRKHFKSLIPNWEGK